MRSSRTLGKSFIIIAIRSISIPIRYALNWFGAYLYGALVMGAFSTTRSFLDVLTVIAGLGGDKVMIRFLTHAHVKDKNFKKLFNALLVLYSVIGLFFAVLVYIASDFIASFYNKPWLSVFFKVTAFTIPVLVILILINQSFKAINKPLLATIFETSIYNILVLVFIIALAFLLNEHKIFGFHMGFLLGTLITLLVALYFLTKKYNNNLLDLSVGINYWTGSQGWHNLKNFFKIAGSIMLISGAYLYLLNLDRILLPRFTSGNNMGVYYIAGRVAGLVQIIGIGLLAITPAKIVRYLDKKGYKYAVSYIAKMSFLALILSIGASLIWLPIIPFLLRLFGVEYVNALSYTGLFLIGAIVFNIGTIAGQGVILLDKQRNLLKYLLLAVILCTLAGWGLLSKYGLIGGGLTYIVAQLGITISNWLVLVTDTSFKTGKSS